VSLGRRAASAAGTLRHRDATLPPPPECRAASATGSWDAAPPSAAEARRKGHGGAGVDDGGCTAQRPREHRWWRRPAQGLGEAEEELACEAGARIEDVVGSWGRDLTSDHDGEITGGYPGSVFRSAGRSDGSGEASKAGCGRLSYKYFSCRDEYIYTIQLVLS